MSNSLAAEIAEAAFASVLPSYTKPKFQDELVRTAKRLQRLQTRKSSLRAHLRAVEADIKQTKRELKALCQQLQKGE